VLGAAQLGKPPTGRRFDATGTEMRTRTTARVITFQSWVTEPGWYDYAVQNPQHVPLLLIDRSPCHDPFFDHYAASEERRPLITGLCRGLKAFQPGDRFLYVTRIHPSVVRAARLSCSGEGPRYFGVAALRVVRIWESHQAAAASFQPRRYVVAPSPTPYPPNLAHDRSPVAAASRASCIVHDGRKALTPPQASATQWLQEYHSYYLRRKDRELRAAECRVETWEGREALKLTPETAPVFVWDDWGGTRPNVNGVPIDDAVADALSTRIAGHRTA
jgi:hypothetical protein